jgi:hypothetical protein
MNKFVAVVGAAFVCWFIGWGAAQAQEEAVSPDKIPKAVMDALLSKFPQAKIDKCTKAKEGDDVVYDIEFKQQDRKCEADIKESGIYINYEKAIAEKDLPKACRDAIEKKYPKATLGDIMEETEVMGRTEKLSAYEVVFVTADKKNGEVRLSPDGKILEDTLDEKPAAKK